MSPYRDPPPPSQPPRRRWWQRLACAVGRHEWSDAAARTSFETIQPCEHCAVVRVWVPSIPQLGEWTGRRPRNQRRRVDGL